MSIASASLHGCLPFPFLVLASTPLLLLRGCLFVGPSTYLISLVEKGRVHVKKKENWLWGIGLKKYFLRGPTVVCC